MTRKLQISVTIVFSLGLGSKISAQTAVDKGDLARRDVAAELFRRALNFEREAWRSLPPSPVLMTRAAFLALEGFRTYNDRGWRQSPLFAQVKNKCAAYGFPMIDEYTLRSEIGNLDLRKYGPADDWVRELSRRKGVNALQLEEALQYVRQLQKDLLVQAKKGKLNFAGIAPVTRSPASSIQGRAIENSELSAHDPVSSAPGQDP